MTATGLRARKKLRTREAIVTEALALFAEDGYQQTTVANIAEAADVSKGTLFAYFRSKEEILFADSAPLREEFFRELRERSSGLSALETIRETLTEHMVNPTDRELLRERLIDEDEQLRNHYRARMTEVEDAIAAAIAADLGEPAGGLRPRIAAAAVLAAMTVAKEDARSVRGQRASREHADAVIDQAVAFLEGGLEAITRQKERA